MSRSKRKPKIGIAYGSNTEFYRDRNRNTRTKNRRILRKALMEGNEDELEFVSNKRNPSYDNWNEPTDGSYLLDKDDPLYEKLCRK